MTKTIKIDGNSTENQEIKGKFVQREVLTCFSYEMEAVLRAAHTTHATTPNADYPLPTYEDIENMYEYKCPECGEGFTDLDEFKPDENDFYWGECPSCEHKLDHEPENEPQEVYEWWIVTEFLYKKLKERGQVVLEWGNNCYWGRTSSGQAIALDGIITDICKEMEILAGQKYSWGKK